MNNDSYAETDPAHARIQRTQAGVTINLFAQKRKTCCRQASIQPAECVWPRSAARVSKRKSAPVRSIEYQAKSAQAFDEGRTVKYPLADACSSVCSAFVLRVQPTVLIAARQEARLNSISAARAVTLKFFRETMSFMRHWGRFRCMGLFRK